ncbi:MAG TPA: thioesterase family protein [Terrimesophilobacter sp.]|nr:thioesterase family protein [Terrimesophilobacter sp.]HRP98848.1 thioesterase family protein [Terrimesophilobacter sp.]
MFGGALLAQAMSAATDADGFLHHAHATFQRSGDPRCTIEYEVTPVRVGTRFSSLVVSAVQGDRELLTLTASIERRPATQIRTSVTPPAGARELRSIVAPRSDSLATWIGGVLDRFGRELHVVGPFPALEHPAQPNLEFWVQHRVDAAVPLAGELSYVADHFLLSTAASLFEVNTDAPGFVTLNHAIWVNAAPEAGAWLTHSYKASLAGPDRVICRGEISAAGRPVATVLQEGLVLPRL